MRFYIGEHASIIAHQTLYTYWTIQFVSCSKISKRFLSIVGITNLQRNTHNSTVEEWYKRQAHVYCFFENCTKTNQSYCQHNYHHYRSCAWIARDKEYPTFQSSLKWFTGYLHLNQYCCLFCVFDNNHRWFISPRYPVCDRSQPGPGMIPQLLVTTAGFIKPVVKSGLALTADWIIVWIENIGDWQQ